MQQTPSVKIGWKVMLAVGIYMLVVGLLYIFLTKPTFRDDFTSFTAKSWSDFLTNNTEAAQLFIMRQRLLGAMVLASGLFIVLIAWKSYRKAEKWSWYTLLATNIIGWASWLTYFIVIRSSTEVVLAAIGIVLFVIGIALPAKAILGKRAA
jgi:uncharacterized membrane protein HdeD (DUF308 family)